MGRLKVATNVLSGPLDVIGIGLDVYGSIDGDLLDGDDPFDKVSARLDRLGQGQAAILDKIDAQGRALKWTALAPHLQA